MKSVKCAQCGFVGWSDAEVCKKCGASMSPAPTGVVAESSNTSSSANSYSAASYPTTSYPSTSYPSTSYPATPYPVSPYPTYNTVASAQLKTGLAITAMVSGIVNFTCLSVFVLPLIAGIIISVVALKKVSNYPHEYGGKPMAVTGLVMNIVSVLIVFPMMLAIVIPNLLASRIAANEGSSQNSIKTIFAAEQTYQATEGRGDYGSLADLGRYHLISAELATGVKSGYQYKVEVITATREHPAAFTAVAVPNEYGSSGRRSFFIDETGILRGEDSHGLEANRSSPEVGSERYYDERRLDRRRSTSYSNDE